MGWREHPLGQGRGAGSGRAPVPFLAAPALQGPRTTPPSSQGRQGGGWHGAERAGDWANVPLPISNTEHFSFSFFFSPRHIQLSLNDSLGLSSPSSRTVVLPLQPGFPSPEHSCSAFKRLLSHASPHRQTGLSFASASRQRLCFYLPSRPHPRGMPAPTAPLPLRSRPLAARGTRRGSLTAR